jgi:hypothetical protein
MPQCTSATFSRVERAGPSERHARLDRPPPSIDRWTGRISTNATSRRRHDGVRRAPEPIRSGRGGARLGWAGPGLCPEWQRERCAGIFRMTTGSCSVAITRRRPPHWERTRVWCSPSCRCGAAPRERTETVTRREPSSPATFDPCSPRRTPERENRRQAVGNGCSGAPLGPRGVILRYGLAREHELAKVQRRVWPQRDSNPCFSHDHVFASRFVEFSLTSHLQW